MVYFVYIYLYYILGFPGGGSGIEPAFQCRRLKRCGSELGRSPGEKRDNIYYLCIYIMYFNR